MKWVQNRKRALFICIVTLFIAIFFGYQNLRVPSSGILKDAILDKENPYYIWHQEAGTYKDLNIGDTLSFVLSFPDGIDRSGVKQIIEMTEAVKQVFPECTIWSLATNSYDYIEQDNVIESKPHLSLELLNEQGELSSDFKLSLWKEQVIRDSSVYGVLIGNDFSYAQLFVFLPENYSGQEVADRTAEFLEQRNITRFEWYLFKNDISPVEKYKNVALGGWSVARGLMHFALISNVIFYSTIGLLISTLAAFFSLGSRRQAIYTALTISLSFILVRGIIPILADAGVEFYGLPLYERVYFLLVLSAMIVAGISFNVRALEAFNDIWNENKNLSYPEIWAKVSPIGNRFNLVAIIAIINFATLPQIGIRGIMEVGILSAIGIIFQRLLVSYFLPSIHILFGGNQKQIRNQTVIRLIEKYNHTIDRITAYCFTHISKHPPQKSRNISMCITVTILAIALLIIGHDLIYKNKWILIREKPIDYLPDTIVDRGREILNLEGNFGFGRLLFLITHNQNAWSETQPGYVSVENPEFIKQAFNLGKKIEKIEGAKTVRSILDKVNHISTRSADYQGDLPSTYQEAHDIFRLIEWDLDDPRLAKYFWCDDGIVLSVSHLADDSQDLRLFSQKILDLIEDQFPQLKAIPYGRLHIYHQTDLYISQRKPLNVLTSFPSVVIVCAIWIFFSNWLKIRDRHQYMLKPIMTGLAMSIPFIFAYSFILILMAIFRLPLDQATACASALGINAAIDFDIYIVDDFMQALFEGKSLDQSLAYALRDRGRVTFIDAKLNAICFSFLMFSQFIPVQRLGAIMVIMMIACAFGVLFLMTGVLRSCVKIHNPIPSGH